jgi:hypothetical protein
MAHWWSALYLYFMLLSRLVMLVHQSSSTRISGRCPVRALANIVAMPNEEFCAIPQSVHTNTRMLPQLGHDYFLQNSTQFITQLPSYHQHSTASDTDSIENKPCKWDLPPCSQHRPTWYCLLRLIADINHQLDLLPIRHSNTTWHLEILLSQLQGNFKSNEKEVICC